jgi:tight adherence protein B
VLGATGGLRYRRRRRSRRGTDEARQLETAIDVLVGELRVGAHPAQAFAVAADETGGPVADSCRAVAARARLGADVTAGLRSVAETSALAAHWDRLAVCWELASEHGLAMSTLMRAAQRDIVERQRFSGHVTSAMAGARATAAILAGLPMLSVLFGQLIGADPAAFLLTGHAGGWLLLIGVTLVCCGLLWSARITDRAAP